MSEELHCNPSCVYRTSMDRGMVCLKHHREALADYESAGPREEETEEALEVFESEPNINLGLSATRVMGGVLARAVRSARRSLAEAVAILGPIIHIRKVVEHPAPQRNRKRLSGSSSASATRGSPVSTKTSAALIQSASIQKMAKELESFFRKVAKSADGIKSVLLRRL